MIRLLANAIFLFAGLQAAAQGFAPFSSRPNFNFLDQAQDLFGHPYRFIFPNETRPHQALEFWRETPGGVYFAVGTERGFMGAAASNADHLFLGDYEAEVVLYNRVNILLLKAADGNLDFFRQLKADPSVLVQAMDGLRLSSEDKNFLRGVANSTWWHQVSETLVEHPIWNPQKNPKMFREVNYHFDSKLFDKLTAMAKSNRIQAEILDLADPTSWRAFVRAVQASGLHFSTVDLSNAWTWGFVGTERSQMILRQSLESASAETMVLLTELRPSGSVVSRLDSPWSYRGASVRHLRTSGFFASKFPQPENPFDHFNESESAFARHFVPTCESALEDAG